MAQVWCFGGTRTPGVKPVSFNVTTVGPLLIPPPIERSDPSPPTGFTFPAVADLVEDQGHERHPDAVRDRYLQRISGFLLSLVLHLVALVVLALIIQRVVPSEPLQITLASADQQSPWSSTEELASISSVQFANADVADATMMDEAVAVEIVDIVEDDLDMRLPGTPITESVSESPSAPDGSGQINGDSKSKNTKIQFFGAEAYGNSFVFVLDISASMAARHGLRLRRATMELIGSINQLNDEQFFSVVLYSTRATPMFLAGNVPEMRQATARNKQAAVNWLRYHAHPNGGTLPAHALHIAGNLKPDAVFFLSDGEFLYGQVPQFGNELNAFFQSFGTARAAIPNVPVIASDPQAVLSAYDPKITVHTIAFESTTSRALMELIAREKGGQHRFIPAP